MSMGAELKPRFGGVWPHEKSTQMLLNRHLYNYVDACHIPVPDAKRQVRGKIMVTMTKEQSAQIAERVRGEYTWFV